MIAGLMVLKLHEAIHVEALPVDIPGEIEVDISELTLERPITIADLPQVKGVTYVDDAEEVLFNMQQTRAKKWPRKPSPRALPSRKWSRRASWATRKKNKSSRLGSHHADTECLCDRRSPDTRCLFCWSINRFFQELYGINRYAVNAHFPVQVRAGA